MLLNFDYSVAAIVNMNLFIVNAVIWLLFGCWNAWIVHGTTLSPLIISDETWTLASSPYYVDSNVIIQTNITVNIENGVEIIFNDNYQITMRGYLNACYDIDTSGYTSRGLADPSNYTSFHSFNESRLGSLYFEERNSYAAFCNVVFEKLNRPIEKYDWSSRSFMIDNCVFNDSYYGVELDGSNNDNHEITDSVFTDMRYAIDGDEVTIDNCYFSDIDYTIISGYRSNIYNSDIVGDGSGTCVSVSYYSEIENSTIFNCGFGIYLSWSYNTIKYNEIRNNSVGVYINSGENNVIKFNNFIENGVNIRLDSDEDLTNGGYNYWGLNSTDQTEIDDTIDDLCSGFSEGIYAVVCHPPFESLLFFSCCPWLSLLFLFFIVINFCWFVVNRVILLLAMVSECNRFRQFG